MIPVFIHRQTVDQEIGYQYHEFEKDFLSICERHYRAKRALAFAFVLYDLQNATVAKVLADKHYWNALDRRSGKFLTIYHIDTSKPEGKVVSRRFEDPFQPATTIVKKHVSDTSFGYLPALMFFQVAENKVVDSLYIKLKEQEVESAFTELASYVSSAVDALKLIRKENRENRVEIFEQVKRNVRSAYRRTTAQRVFHQVLPVVEFVSIFRV